MQDGRTWVQAVKNNIATGCATALFSTGTGNYLSLVHLNAYVSNPTTSAVFRFSDGVTSSALFSVNGATYTAINYDFTERGLQLGSAGNSLLLVNNSSGTIQVTALGFLR